MVAFTENSPKTVKAMSGSPIVSEGGDFNTAIMAADGTCLLMGVYVGAHAATQATVVRSIIADYGLDFVKDGDMFLCNDPWKGALHQSDVACVAPIFIGDRLVAWVGSVLHQLDVGGPAAGGFNVHARSIYDEPVPFPPVKIVRERPPQAGYRSGLSSAIATSPISCGWPASERSPTVTASTLCASASTEWSNS